MTALSDRLAEARKQKEAQENAASLQQVYNDRREVARPLMNEVLDAYSMVFMLDDNAEPVADFDATNFDSESADELIEILKQFVSDMRGELADSDDDSVEPKKARKPLGVGKKFVAVLNRIP